MDAESELWRREEVERRLGGIATSSLYRLMKDEGFPQPIRLSPKRTGWVAAEVIAWVQQRPRGTTGKAVALRKPIGAKRPSRSGGPKRPKPNAGSAKAASKERPARRGRG